MKNITRYVAVATTGLLMATSLSLAATKRERESAREAAIRKCNAETIKQVPLTPGNLSYQQQRTAVWKDCMVTAGQRP